MRKKIVLFLSVWGMSFGISFVGSLAGVALTALVLGYSAVKMAYNGAPHQNFLPNAALSKKILSRLLLIFLAMELGFLVSALFSIGILENWSASLVIFTGLSLGFSFFVIGFLAERYEKAVKVCRRLNKKKNWRNLIRFAAL